MSFFDSIAKSVKKQIGNQVADKLAGEIVNRVGKALGGTQSSHSSHSAAQSASGSAPAAAAAVRQETASDTPLKRATAPAYFIRIIRESYPDYAVSEISPDFTGLRYGSKEAFPNLLLVSRGGIPTIGVILVSSAGKNYRNRAYYRAVDACRQRGISSVRFIREFPNEKNYVTNRLRPYFKG